jgi:DNA polymerase elongation subunit (family B)
MGREIITHTKDFLETRGYKVVVSDTDSSYFISKKIDNTDVIVEGKEILELVNKEYPRWINEKWGISEDRCYIRNVFKKVYERLIVGTKKRYCGHVIWAKGITSDKQEVVGLECKRSDYSRFARNLQYDLIKMLLKDKSNEEVLSFLKDKVSEMKTVLPELIGIPTKIEKELDEYVTNLPKVRGASYSNKITNINFYRGDKPLLLFTKGESDIILFFNNIEAYQLLSRVRVDWGKMIERNILLPTEMLLKSDGRQQIHQSLSLLINNQRTLFDWE